MNEELARRTDVEVYFNGVDISESLRKYLLSLSFTDQEEDETDDLQIKMEDRDGVWLTEWLNAVIQASESDSSSYKVIAKSGLNVRSGPGKSNSKLGILAYGTQIKVISVSNGWATINYSGKTAYVSKQYLAAINSINGNWAAGEAVIANGQPQYSSYGTGTAGDEVTNYSGTISKLNIKNGVPYPIHVGSLGWFGTDQVKKATVSGSSASSTRIKGLSIQAVFIRKNWNGDGEDKSLECGQFVIDSIDAEGPPAVITIKATSLPYSSQVRQKKKNKAWESYNLSKIANKIASSNGMSCIYESEIDPYYSRIEQVSMSDIAFLKLLCQSSGVSLKITNNIIVLFDQATYEAKPAVFTIDKGSGIYMKYRLSTGTNDKEYDSCRVSYINPVNKKMIQATAYVAGHDLKDKQNQCLEVTAKVNDKNEAKTLAEKLLRLKNKNEYTATFDIPGNPDLIAGVTVMLNGWGLWNGKYIVSYAKHSVSGSGYSTQIKIRRVLEGY